MGWAVRRLDGPATSVDATQVHPRRSMRALARAGRNWGQDARLVSASNHFQMPLSMSARLILRLEGLGVLTAAIALYASLNTSWWLFAALLLAPDVFMIGYLAGPRLGALLYNMGTYVRRTTGTRRPGVRRGRAASRSRRRHLGSSHRHGPSAGLRAQTAGRLPRHAPQPVERRGRLHSPRRDRSVMPNPSVGRVRPCTAIILRLAAGAQRGAWVRGHCLLGSAQSRSAADASNTSSGIESLPSASPDGA